MVYEEWSRGLALDIYCYTRYLLSVTQYISTVFYAKYLLSYVCYTRYKLFVVLNIYCVLL